MMARLFALILFLASPLMAEEVVLGMSQNRIAITANFDGSEILLFGAVKREEQIQSSPPLEVVVAISGPSQPVTVRKKSKKLGIWVNTESVDVDLAPSFYAVATSGPFDEIMSHVEDLRHKVSISRLIRSVGAPMDVQNAQRFSDAVVRIRTDNGLYQMLEGAVDVDQQTLFRTSIKLPANLTEGDYSTRIFLTRGGEVVSHYETTIDVRKVGLERWLFNLSRQQPLAYGFLSLAIAIIAGWGASAAFQFIRQGG
ncbi:TIGR02186 family protein [Shimia sediminis]|uniref:TIGR02186 family protein n=1 Tax=Shimia sediminis TaxID=2497945 RepID=UPI000F8E28A9|nr:TIGR02186 family protein [Shimia sediminis]